MSWIAAYKSQVNRRESLKAMWQRSAKDDPLIDGLRGSCIILIILFHSFYGILFLLRKPEPVLAFINRVPLWLSFGFSADKAVDIFFVVSAYLLGSSLFKDVLRGKKIPIREFYLKRLARIYPLFLLALSLYAFVNPKRSLKYLFYNLFFIDNFDFKSIIPVGWSLSIEMQFYAILPWFALGLFRLSEKKQPILIWGLFGLSFLIQLLVCLLYPVIYETPFFNFHPDRVDPTVMMDRLYYPTHTRFGPLVLGLMWAYLKVRKDYVQKVPRWLTHKTLSASMTGLGIGIMAAMTLFPVYQSQTWYYRHFSPTLNLLLHISHRNLYALGLWLVMVTVTLGTQRSQIQEWIAKVLSWRMWRPFAQTVFPIYLFHFPMIALAGLSVFRTTDIRRIGPIGVEQVFLICALAAVYSLMLATILHVFIEVPMMRLGYGWAQRRSNHRG